jgi:hypothetical protein
MQVLVRALLLLAQELRALQQLHGRLVVFEQELRLLVQVELELQQQELELARLHLASKYLVGLLALVLVGRLQLELQLAHLPAGYSGSKSPTLQVLTMDLLDSARTFLQRANHLHQNLVLKTRKRSFAFRLSIQNPTHIHAWRQAKSNV